MQPDDSGVMTCHLSLGGGGRKTSGARYRLCLGMVGTVLSSWISSGWYQGCQAIHQYRPWYCHGRREEKGRKSTSSKRLVACRLLR